jgi:hypothetical protein
MRRRTFLGNAAAAGLGLTAWGLPAAPAYADPIGTGWTEIHPTYKVDQPPGLARHTVSSSGEHHFWIHDTDPSTYPGHDSGPRSELRFHNDYTSGQAQFEADIKVTSGTYKPCVMQIFGASTQATAFMMMAMNNSFNYYTSSQVIYAPIYDTYLHVNVLHDTATRKVDVYVNRQLRGTFTDHGTATHYFKCGVYGRPGMSQLCDAYIKNIRIYRK